MLHSYRVKALTKLVTAAVSHMLSEHTWLNIRREFAKVKLRLAKGGMSDWFSMGEMYASSEAKEEQSLGS